MITEIRLLCFSAIACFALTTCGPTAVVQSELDQCKENDGVLPTAGSDSGEYSAVSFPPGFANGTLPCIQSEILARYEASRNSIAVVPLQRQAASNKY
jgi:hypothetical protein